MHNPKVGFKWIIHNPKVGPNGEEDTSSSNIHPNRFQNLTSNDILSHQQLVRPIGHASEKLKLANQACNA
jgi:hypothetical protein